MNQWKDICFESIVVSSISTFSHNQIHCNWLGFSLCSIGFKMYGSELWKQLLFSFSDFIGISEKLTDYLSRWPPSSGRRKAQPPPGLREVFPGYGRSKKTYSIHILSLSGPQKYISFLKDNDKSIPLKIFNFLKVTIVGHCIGL